MALGLFSEGADGFLWWSSLESSWTNVTLFGERALPLLEIAVPPDPIDVHHPAVQEAASTLGVVLSGRGPGR